jgi:hypothetical protein
VAAGSTTSPPRDRSGAVPPLGQSQFPQALIPGQRSSSCRWHPGCRRCLLKGCQRWFLPSRPQARYCGPTCRLSARRWWRWLASQRYRATPNGQQHRRDQARRYRSRVRQRSSLPHPDPPNPPAEPTPPAAQAAEPTPPAAQAQRPMTTDSSTAISVPGVGQRPVPISEKSLGLPCHRPGCYVLFLPAVRWLDQKFCSHLCRRALRRVRQREARLRHRRRFGARRLHIPDHGPPQATQFMSSHP